MVENRNKLIKPNHRDILIIRERTIIDEDLFKQLGDGHATRKKFDQTSECVKIKYRKEKTSDFIFCT